MNKFYNSTLRPFTVAGITFLVFCFSFAARAQPTASDSVLQNATLENVVEYAIRHQPLIQQSIIDQEATNAAIRSRLADWYPQVNFNYNLTHNFVLQPTFVPAAFNPTQIVRFGAINTSLAQFALTQNVFNRDVFLASKTATAVRVQALETTSSNKINVAVNVTKAFYDVLATEQQISVGLGDIIRLQRSLRDTYNQYSAGVADKTDFKRATITLNNTKATLKSNQELLIYKTEYLKSLIGYPVSVPLQIHYDTLQMENEIRLDTLQQANYADRIEYKLLMTQRALQDANVKYNEWSFLPTVALSGSYNFYFFDHNPSLGAPKLDEVYRYNTPYSLAALTFSIPLFQGGKRVANIKQQKWMLRRLDWDVKNLKSTVNVQYAQTMASYKSNLATFLTLKQNVELAREVYDVIQLQYKTGVKTYLEVITAETDLRTARINYYNALYQVMSSKIDVEKALGQIIY
jgi:outer membrane protein